MSEYDLTQEVNALGRAPKFLIITGTWPMFGLRDWVYEMFMAPPLGQVEDWSWPIQREWWCGSCFRKTALTDCGCCEFCGNEGVQYVG